MKIITTKVGMILINRLENLLLKIDRTLKTNNMELEYQMEAKMLFGIDFINEKTTKDANSIASEAAVNKPILRTLKFFSYQ
jgi:hypothetical protein